MIYLEAQADSFSQFHLKLEEAICLSHLTSKRLFVKSGSPYLGYLDSSYYEVVDSIPEKLVEADMTDYLCMFSSDQSTIDGEDFVSYRKNQSIAVLTLDRFSKNDFHILLKKPSLYEAKYFSSDQRFKDAKKAAASFSFSENANTAFSFLRDSLVRMPLVCVKREYVTGKPSNFPFTECYLYGDKDVLDSFAETNNLKATKIEEYLLQYSVGLAQYDIEMLLALCLECFDDIYGMGNDYLYMVLSKMKMVKDPTWKPRVIGRFDYALIENFNIREVKPKATFSFAKYDLNCQRNDLFRLVRFPECVDY